MSKINIFQAKYIDLFTEYGYGINCISDILQGIGYADSMSSKQAKNDALNIIEQLFNNNIIYVAHWGSKDDHSKYKDKRIEIEEVMSIIKSQWFDGADYSDFFGMITFFYKDWYMKKLNELGINDNIDWEWFKDKVLPDMKNWKETNKKEVINVNQP